GEVILGEGGRNVHTRRIENPYSRRLRFPLQIRITIPRGCPRRWTSTGLTITVSEPARQRQITKIARSPIMSTTTYSWSDEVTYENTSWSDSSGNLDGQQPVITLRAAFTLQSDASVNRKYLTVDLSNTTVSASNKQPAAIVDNSSSARGWYTEEVQI